MNESWVNSSTKGNSMPQFINPNESQGSNLLKETSKPPSPQPKTTPNCTANSTGGGCSNSPNGLVDVLIDLLRLSTEGKAKIIANWIYEHERDGNADEFIMEAIWEGYTGLKGAPPKMIEDEWNNFLEQMCFDLKSTDDVVQIIKCYMD
jgi:hypothetical protein